MRFLKENKTALVVSFLAITALLCLFFFWLDRETVLLMKGIRSDMSDLNRFLIFIHHPVNNLFHGSTLLAISVSLYVIGKLFRSRLSEVAKYLILGFLLSGISSQILKNLFGRMRPKFTADTIFIGPSLKDMYHSFPSGHTAVVFCLASVLSRFYPRFSLLFYFVAAVAGFDRIFLFQHFPSDVIAGAVLGVICGKALPMIISRYALQGRFSAGRRLNSAPMAESRRGGNIDSRYIE